jgi:hypothetical protein
MFEKSGFDNLVTYVFTSSLTAPFSSSFLDLFFGKLIFSSGNRWHGYTYRALYIRGSDYETSDAVFGVKESLIVSLDTVTPEQANKYEVKEGTKLLKYDFVLVTDEETKQLRHDEAVKAMKSLGREGMMIVNGLPVPDVD